MIIKYVGDIIESYGFTWTGVRYYTCGFYRIYEIMGTYYLQKFLRYKDHRSEYESICYLYVHPVPYSWTTGEVNEKEFNKFKKCLLKASRDTKLKRMTGYFKYSEEHYSMLHCKN